jgi:hypothetical protein
MALARGHAHARVYARRGTAAAHRASCVGAPHGYAYTHPLYIDVRRYNGHDYTAPAPYARTRTSTPPTRTDCE